MLDTAPNPILKTSQHNANINAYYDSAAVELFEEFAQQQIHLGYWDDRYPQVNLDQAAKRLTQVVISFVDLPKDGRFLDIGCGCGIPAMEIAKQKQCYVEGITINPQQKQKADRLARNNQMADRISFTLGDATSLPYLDNQFDGALLLESIHHIGHERALSEASRVLKPKAEILIADGVAIKNGASRTDRERLSEIFVARSLASAKELSDTMASTGFEVTDFIDLTQAIQPTWSKLIAETENRKRCIVHKHGLEFYTSFKDFWHEIMVLWTRSAQYLMVRGYKKNSVQKTKGIRAKQ